MKKVTTNKALTTVYPNLDERLDQYIRRLCWTNPEKTPTECDPTIVEYFGVLRLTDIRSPRRKLWYLYYCRSDQVDGTVDRILQKYGEKNMNELFRKPILSGADLRFRVKKHFRDSNWYVKGNILEAPTESVYNNERVIRIIAKLYNAELRSLYNFLANSNKNYTAHRMSYMST